MLVTTCSMQWVRGNSIRRSMSRSDAREHTVQTHLSGSRSGRDRYAAGVLAGLQRLQLSVTRRVSNGLHVLYKLTRKDHRQYLERNRSATVTSKSIRPQQFLGLADYDAICVITYRSFMTPDLQRVEVHRYIHQWVVNTIFNASTGSPFTVLSGTDRSLSGIGGDYADRSPTPDGQQGPARLHSTQHRCLPGSGDGTFGNSKTQQLAWPRSGEPGCFGCKNLPSERALPSAVSCAGIQRN